MTQNVLPLPHVTVSHGDEIEGELCFEWWFGADEKITVYATPTTVLRKYGAEQADPPTPKVAVEWLREAITARQSQGPSAEWQPKIDERVVHTLALAHGEYGFGRIVGVSWPDWVRVEWSNGLTTFEHVDCMYPLKKPAT